MRWPFASAFVFVLAAGGCEKKQSASAFVEDSQPPTVVVEDTQRAIDSVATVQQSPDSADSSAMTFVPIPEGTLLALSTSDDPSAPLIERRPEGPVLVLSAEMGRALAAAVPEFRHPQWSHYAADLRRAFPPTETSALFASIGDFDGDQRADVVVHGHDPTRGLVLVLFNRSDSVRVFIVEELPRSRVHKGGRLDFISLVEKGLIEADTLDGDEYRKVPVRLDHDAFELVDWGKGASFYYWRNGRFVQWITSD